MIPFANALLWLCYKQHQEKSNGFPKSYPRISPKKEEIQDSRFKRLQQSSTCVRLRVKSRCGVTSPPALPLSRPTTTRTDPTPKREYKRRERETNLTVGSATRGKQIRRTHPIGPKRRFPFEEPMAYSIGHKRGLESYEGQRWGEGIEGKQLIATDERYVCKVWRVT